MVLPVKTVIIPENQFGDGFDMQFRGQIFSEHLCQAVQFPLNRIGAFYRLQDAKKNMGDFQIRGDIDARKGDKSQM